MAIGVDESRFIAVYRLVDLIIPFFSLYLLSQFMPLLAWTDTYTKASFLGGLFFIIFAQIFGVYRDWLGRLFFDSVKFVMYAWLLTLTLLIVLDFFYKESESSSRAVIGLWSISIPLLLITYRLVIMVLLYTYRNRWKKPRYIAILGAGAVGQNLACVLTESLLLGRDVVRFYDDNPQLHATKINNIPIVGATEKACLEAKNGVVQELYICLPMRSDKKIRTILHQMTNTTTIVKYIPDLFSFDMMYPNYNNLRGIPVISVFDSPLNHVTSNLLKRIEDLILSTIIILLVSPILIALAIGVKLTSPGPVLYHQSRLTLNGAAFKMLKFRSMPVDVEKHGVEWGGAKNKTFTRFGQFIRATSLDELPQFLNVLAGDMSIVGPRPERDVFVDKFRDEIPCYMQKHMVKAGITGWAQVRGLRGDTSLEKRIKSDLYYIDNWSIWLDVEIIVLTIIKGFINKNAR